MKHSVIKRDEMLEATLELGGASIELAEYATTGLLGLAVGPRGHCKTNAGLLIGEQLAQQGWISVFIDPESELESLYGDAVADAEELSVRLELRDQSIVVVSARSAAEFVDYGRAIIDAADRYRKPIYVMVDEGQCFSSPRKRKDNLGESADIINEFVERGRKRALDLFITALRYTGTLHRSVFANTNLKLIGCQEDPTVWSALAPQFKAAKIEFNDLSRLAPGEFYCMSRGGIEKIRMPMAEALRGVAPRARDVKRSLPSTFTEWDRAMREIPTPRLMALSDPVVSLLGSVAGLSAQQMMAGSTALQDELASR